MEADPGFHSVGLEVDFEAALEIGDQIPDQAGSEALLDGLDFEARRFLAPRKEREVIGRGAVEIKIAIGPG